MPTVNRQSPLAVLGGSPAWPDPVRPPAWPPVNDAVADRLAELYLSRKWSFNSPAEQAFEQAFAECHGAKHGIFMMNGTVTLQCALGALGVGPGDEVLVPAMTWVATAMAPHYVGATPVIVDVEPDTFCIDVAAAERAITPRTKAIMPVHAYGSMADLDAVLELAERYGLAVVEDCAHMHGGKWRGRGVGSWGAVGSFSFQQSKPMAAGEGGICLTNDDALAERLWLQKHIGYRRGVGQGQARTGPPEGLTCHNFRATAFQALILQDQLEQLPRLIARFEAACRRVREGLEGVPGVRVQAPGRCATTQGCYGLGIVFDGDPVKDVPMPRLMEAMRAEGAGLTGSYGAVYRHNLFNLPSSRYRLPENGCPVAETIVGERTGMIMKEWFVCDVTDIDRLVSVIAKVATHATDLLNAEPA